MGIKDYVAEKAEGHDALDKLNNLEELVRASSRVDDKGEEGWWWRGRVCLCTARRCRERADMQGCLCCGVRGRVLGAALSGALQSFLEDAALMNDDVTEQAVGKKPPSIDSEGLLVIGTN